MGTATLKKGQLVELRIESAGFEGLAVGRLNEFVIFVRNAVPGDLVEVVIRRKKRKFAEATVEEILEPSPFRVEPRCSHFGTCGGCRWQNAQYEMQLDFKRKQVEELFRRVGGLPPVEVLPTLRSPREFHYRNKMEFTFGTSRWLTREEIASGLDLDRGFALGLHIPRRFDKILDLETCFLQRSPSSELLNQVRSLSRQEQWSAYDTREHHGYLRNLVIRTGENTGEVMVNLVTSRGEPKRMELLKTRLLGEFPEITTLINSVNETRSPVAAGVENVLHGPGTINERIGRLNFTIAPTTFFQPNTLQAERLYETVRQFAGLTGDEVVYDLYSGIGCISLFLADGAKRVIAIESDLKAVEASEMNAIRNGVRHCSFFSGDSLEAFRPGFVRRYGTPDVLVLDPPRAGLEEALVTGLVKVRPARIVYVSCNPATQARDLSRLSAFYDVEVAQPVDMFPHTYHIENVVSLKLREPAAGLP